MPHIVPPATQPLLQVDNLHKYFSTSSTWGRQLQRQVYALAGVSLSLAAGKTLGLVGESGCGKSTLARTILRLYEPTSGSIHFNGHDITKFSLNELRPLRSEMQIIFQDPYSSLNPRMTIAEILAEPLLIHRRASKDEIPPLLDQLLERVGLARAVKNRFPHEFSGGQKQRIGIARAIALSPRLIVADEPVSALDVSIQSQILNLLLDLQRDLGLAYLFISHDLAVIEHCSDQVAVMYLGRIVEQAARADLYRRPLHPYTQALIAAIPRPRVPTRGETLRSRTLLAGDVPNPSNPPAGCHFHPRCPLASERCLHEAPILGVVGSNEHPHLVACHNVR